MIDRDTASDESAPLDPDGEALVAARRAYERGRLAWSVRRAAYVTVATAAVGVGLFGAPVLPFLPATFAATAMTAYRGGALHAGFLRGAGGGIVSLFMPISLLRPCCAAGAAGASCCAAPSMCSLYGALLGGAFALLLPRTKGPSRLAASAGLLLGVVAVGVMRCEAMLVGEIIGLFLGVAIGCATLSTARMLVDATSK